MKNRNERRRVPLEESEIEEMYAKGEENRERERVREKQRKGESEVATIEDEESFSFNQM